MNENGGGQKDPVRVLMCVGKLNIGGGAEGLVMDWYRGIDRGLLQFDFLTHTPRSGDASSYEDEIISLGGRVFYIRRSFLHYLRYQKELRKFFCEHPEIKTVQSHINAMSAPVLRAAKKSGMPVRIAHSHTTRLRPDLKMPLKILSKLMLRRYATHLFACSKRAGEWLFGKKTVRDGGVTVIPNAINVRRFEFDAAKRAGLRQKLWIGENQPVFGHVGRFIYAKNHGFIIDIFAEIKKESPGAVLLLIGDGELMGDIKQKCRDLEVWDSVIFAGTVGNIEEYLWAMDAFLFPSRFEGVPCSVIEAQAAGLPCLISDTVTSEVGITSLAEFLSLKSPPEVWAKKALAATAPNERKSMHDEIKAAGFDSADAAKKLQEFYLKTILRKN